MAFGNSKNGGRLIDTDASLDDLVRPVMSAVRQQRWNDVEPELYRSLGQAVVRGRSQAKDGIVLPDDKHLEWVRQQARCAERRADE
jgi:hypothetical protein